MALVDPAHELVVGTIGMGKSYWVLGKIIESFRHNRPCCYIDPKGDTYRNLLAYFAGSPEGRALWAQYQERIILLNPVSPSGYLVGFNALEPMGEFFQAHPDTVALLANSTVAHIKRQAGWEQKANRLEAIMLAAIGLAVSGRLPLTLAELPLLFEQTKDEKGKYETFNPLTAALLSQSTHHGTKFWWRHHWGNWTGGDRREWVNSTDNQVFKYVFDERSLLTICTRKNATLDFRKLIDGGYWLFVNLPYQYLGETVTTLIGNLITTKIFLSAMQREPVADYRLILDEARFFATGPLDVVLNTSRAFRLWLTLVVQSLDQLSRPREGYADFYLKETALNVARYFTVFNDTNVDDVELLARLMFPITGRIPAGFLTNETLPVAAEVDLLQRRFMQLAKREVVLWDKFGGQPRRWPTPTVAIMPVETVTVARLEAQHLAHTGRPVSAIRAEIYGHGQLIDQLFFAPKPGEEAPRPEPGAGEAAAPREPRFRPGKLT